MKETPFSAIWIGFPLFTVVPSSFSVNSISSTGKLSNLHLTSVSDITSPSPVQPPTLHTVLAPLKSSLKSFPKTWNIVSPVLGPAFGYTDSSMDTVDKAYVTDLKKIFKNYLWNGFIPNAIYVFPFYLFDDSLEIVRLLKIYRYPKISNKTKAILSWILSLFLKNSLILSHIIRVTTLFLSLCYILHICACVYCFLGLKYANSWIWQYPELVDSSNIVDIYVSSYYFITETFSSTGYGDLTPINSAEILFIMFCQILNCGLYAYLLSNILETT